MTEAGKSAIPDGDPAEILAAIVESSDDAIMGESLDGVIVSWNPSAERLYGYAGSEVIGQPATLLVPPDRAEEVRANLARVRNGERVESYETVRLARGGRPVHVRLTISPVRDKNGRIVGGTVVTSDVSDRRQLDLALRATEARWRAVIDSAVDAIVVIDARGLIEALNPAAERMFGYAEAETIGRNVTMLMPSPYREEHDRYIERYLKTGEQRIIGIGREVTGRRRDGETFPVHLSVGEFRAGAERHFTGILHDLSARVRLEEQLREQSALARLGEMGAVIAHEVRNPLAAVRGAVQVIGGHLPAESKDAQVIKEIVARLDALNGLLNDLLLFARTPAPRVAPLALSGLLTLTSDFLARDPAYRDVTFEIAGDPPPIVGDAELLMIVFQNLFINAAQAMQGRGTVRVTVSEKGGDQRVTVADAGPGISPEVLAKLFHPFYTTKARGTGLGLSIARRLVELHQGTISVECPPGGGTSVTVTLPNS